ncbi:helix-turn-helix transcriptional regulator [Curtobacterium pusillum]|uniref:Helix-turn-helix domain-containing protein n=1 Tax=Curtobacterium pusillum TaxID=69373 RepID=A0ABX2MCC8_9MICO|nr:helix-turn-helix transcriptional regulator [Curtobacterium pusillum]NUU15108.1 helix-turn-helix domain-containing protein [Curtobacterium pusillum]GLK31565.1 transcriptional regulator [Curtobacterium pusillum]
MSKNEVKEFLVSRRARVTPDQVGLPVFTDDRRVPGLRRQEVATLAGLSTDYYTRLERGAIQGASESVLSAISGALLLSDVEREHLFDLARRVPVVPKPSASAASTQRVRPSVQRMLDNLAVPGVVQNQRHDLLASNLMGRALYSPHFEMNGQPNTARFIFLDPRARDYFADWPLARRMTAAMLRLSAGRDPLDEDLTALIGELATRSPQFRQDWADHDVHEHTTGRKVFNHPVVGPLEVTFDGFEMPGEPGLLLVTYTVDEGTASAERLAVLSSWAATQEFSTTR